MTEISEGENNKSPTDNENQIPAVRPPRKISRPKISLKIPAPLPPQLAPIFTATPGMMTIPLTPATGLPKNYPNYPIHFFQAYPNKAQEFMFKQFRGFKDMTMNTGKVGLSFGEKFVFWTYGRVRQWSRNGFTHIFLFLVMAVYCFCGGLLFYMLESGNESNTIREFESATEKMINETCKAILRKKGVQAGNLEREIKHEIMNLVDFLKKNNSKFGKEASWNLISAILYCGTVFTTIGYGHMAPVTSVGRIATIIYALFGIPMFLILLADYGKLFTRSIKFVWAFIRRLYYTGSCRKVRRTIPVQEVIKGMQMMYDMTTRRDSSREGATIEPNTSVQANMTPDPSCTPALSAYTIDDTFNLPISVAFVILLLYMIAGAYIFSFTENWEFLDSFYFVFISTSTIGFGDIVPEGQICAMLISLIYFIFGLALTSMFINVIQEKLSDSFKQATAKIGATMGFEVPYVETGQPVLADPEQ